MNLATSAFILKITSRCNLNCTYCYMFNKGDNSFLEKSKIMDRQVSIIALKKILRYAEKQNLKSIVLVLHGGEPLLAGYQWVKNFLESLRRLKPPSLKVSVFTQTNATLIDYEWIRIFNEYNVHVGISLDGPPEWNDLQRIDHAGNGSYNRVRKAIDLLINSDEDSSGCGVLVVANPNYPSVKIYNHLVKLGIKNMDFLWPDHHYDDPPPWKQGALSKYFIELFDLWFNQENYDVKVRWFEEVIRILLGRKCYTRGLGLGLEPVTDIVIETDGGIEPSDTLRICGNGITNVGLNVLNNNIEEIYSKKLFQQGLNNLDTLPDQCKRCKAYNVCGGGVLTHRWRKKNGFSNPSIHCSDLRTTITHIENSIKKQVNL